jgi:hypothetical protein
MITTSVGLFDNISQVVRAVGMLRGCGFSRDEISVVTQPTRTVTFRTNTVRLRIAMAINSPAMNALTTRTGVKSNPKSNRRGRGSMTQYG